MATLAALTVWGIVDAYRRFIGTGLFRSHRVIVSGGGSRNPALMAGLERGVRQHPGRSERRVRPARRCQGSDRVRDPGLRSRGSSADQPAVSDRRLPPGAAREDHRMLSSGRVALRRGQFGRPEKSRDRGAGRSARRAGEAWGFLAERQALFVQHDVDM